MPLTECVPDLTVASILMPRPLGKQVRSWSGMAWPWTRWLRISAWRRAAGEAPGGPVTPPMRTTCVSL